MAENTPLIEIIFHSTSLHTYIHTHTHTYTTCDPRAPQWRADGVYTATKTHNHKGLCIHPYLTDIFSGTLEPGPECVVCPAVQQHLLQNKEEQLM